MFYKDDFKFFAAWILGCILFFSLLFGLALLLSREQCATYGLVTERETQWRLFGGCFINTEGGWQSEDEYIARSTASEGLSQ